jgi:hypothetical protein
MPQSLRCFTIKNNSLYLKSFHLCSTPTVLDNRNRAFKKWFKFLKYLKKFKGEIIKQPEFRHKNKAYKTLTYEKTVFKIIGTKMGLFFSKESRKWLKEKHGRALLKPVVGERYPRRVQTYPELCIYAIALLIPSMMSGTPKRVQTYPELRIYAMI